MGEQAARSEIDYGSQEDEMQAYLAEGRERALGLDNRGPVRFVDGRIAEDILESYWHHGFYVFENVLSADELSDIEADLEAIMERLPAHEGAAADSQGRPALGATCTTRSLFWSKPLGDPFGGTSFGKGRHPVKMFEPEPADDAPSEIVYLITGSLQYSEACLRAYAHPDLLAVSAAVNGEDFVPYTDALFIKAPGLGASVAWHQDGVTHWDSPSWHQGSHGFNLMGQVFGCTPANAVWVVPGSHKEGRIDIKARVAAAGTERLPEAVPMVCNPGDTVISNRQLLHCSFANTSEDWRVTVNTGCLPRSSVLGVEGGGILGDTVVYDEAHIRERSKVIGYAIAARRQRFPDEPAFVYQPFADAGEHYTWKSSMLASLRDYHRLDMNV